MEKDATEQEHARSNVCRKSSLDSTDTNIDCMCKDCNQFYKKTTKKSTYSCFRSKRKPIF